jgi:hypothetical protein
MNGAERRLARRDHRRLFRDDLQKFHESAKGVFEVHIIRPDNLPSLILSSLAADPSALLIIEALNGWVRAFSHPTLCLNCDARVGNPTDLAAFIVVLPIANSGATIVAGVCEFCAVGDLNEIALRRMRQVWPDLHVKEGGNA